MSRVCPCLLLINKPDAEVEHVNPAVEASGGEDGAGVGGPRYTGHLKL